MGCQPKANDGEDCRKFQNTPVLRPTEKRNPCILLLIPVTPRITPCAQNGGNFEK